ncbi:MAG: DNA polymerase III subunit chi [Halieaceae bacterium]
MTEVDFYVLDTEQPEQRNLFACRLTDKVFRRGHQVYLHTDSEQSARDLDQLLWGFRPQSFVPHGLLGTEHSERVAIGWGEDPGEHHDVMINLDLSVPAFVGRFQRVAEIVVQHPQVRDPLRESWKRYKHYGYPVKRNNL